MRKQTLLFVFALTFTLLAGCWNKPFDPEAWNAAEDDYTRCAMVTNLLDILVGKSRAEYGEMFGPIPGNEQVDKGLYVGACWLGCHGGGIIFIDVYYENDIIVKAVRSKS